jgi:hypothetical protein
MNNWLHTLIVLEKRSKMWKRLKLHLSKGVWREAYELTTWRAACVEVTGRKKVVVYGNERGRDSRR